MLTRKQLWRRTPNPNRSKRFNTNDEPEPLQPLTTSPTSTKHSIESQVKPVPVVKSILKKEGNRGDPENGDAKVEKKVSMLIAVKVLMIPPRSELNLEALFWNSCDYQKFKAEAIAEIKDTADKFHVSTKIAMKFLYQPSSPKSVRDSQEFVSSKSSISSSDSESDLENPIERAIRRDLHFITNAKTDVELNGLFSSKYCLSVDHKDKSPDFDYDYDDDAGCRHDFSQVRLPLSKGSTHDKIKFAFQWRKEDH